MKKTIAKTAAMIAAIGAFSFSAFADVYVTIANDKGELAVPQFGIELSDADGDGTLTINDVMLITHDKYYEGGAEAGFATADSEYGKMITKFWGVENGGSYGYYLNNTMAMGLSDPVKDGDYLNAFIFKDTTGFSDVYCYFDQHEVEASGNSENPATAKLKLSAVGFDENFAPITVPVEGAKITLSGSPTDYVTDANGEVEITFPPREGSYIISAVSETQTLVPPVCVASVKALEEAAPAETKTETKEENKDETAVPGKGTGAGDVSAATTSSKGSPDTGIGDIAVISGIAVLAAGAVIVSKKRK